ncbi:MAG: DNA-directed DNA polymerase II small subunit [Candidatus Micrarchaeota archaeon]|nr:DNA-directed DNA polymerase II small subunit [Candidatus Micrarchaeota archaeon]
MQEDIDFLYSNNIRLTKRAFDYLKKNKIEQSVLKSLAQKPNSLLDLEDILEQNALEKKIKTPPSTSSIVLPTPGQQVYSHSPTIEKDEKEDKDLELKKEEPIPKIGLDVKEVEIVKAEKFKSIAKEYSPNIKVQEQDFETINLKDMAESFIAYFRDRFEQISSILSKRQSTLPTVNLSNLSKYSGQEVRVIGMVYDKRQTAKGNILLELEDEYGQLRVVVPSSEACFAQAQTIIKDDIIAVEGKVLENMFIAKSIFWPDISVLKTFPQASEDLAIVYLSDLHFGSRYFLEKPFKRFLRWLEGKEGNENLASKVKYIVIAGDIVDGIGVYPSQEEDLLIKDIFAQYKEFEKALEQIPDYISVIVGPGNHDAIRRAEPQPKLDKSLLSTTQPILITSPATVKIEEFNHLIYHGTSLDSLISSIPAMSYARPELAMKEILKRRHLSPIYGDNLIIPSSKDFMVVKEEPDILHMGHIHRNAAERYRGVLMINSGTYQDRTDYQIKMGHVPTPAITPLLELKTGQLYHLKFLEHELL